MVRIAIDPTRFRLAPPRPLTAHPALDQHAIQLYERDDFLLEGVTRFVAAGIGEGEATLVIITEAHRVELERRLAGGIDLDRARRDGSYAALDAAETLAKVVVAGHPYPERFERLVGALIDRATEGPPVRRSRVFGEMVALLWASGQPHAAIELERLWNGFAAKRTFSLLHGYPLQAFAGAEHDLGFTAVTAAHAHVAPTESYLELDPDERMRAAAELQQRVASLEAELMRAEGR